MDGWVDGGWIDGWMDYWMDGCMDRWMDRWMDGYMDGWYGMNVMDGMMNEQMDGFIERKIQINKACHNINIYQLLCQHQTYELLKTKKQQPAIDLRLTAH